ncbi:MAG: beta-ketoacyl-ACP synthase II [Rhodothermales bacterium]
MPNQQRRVAVTGMGALTPLGLTVGSFWEAMMRGESGAVPITYFDAEPFSTTFACQLPGYDPLDYFARKEVRRLDLFSQYAIVAAERAVQDAGLDTDTMPAEQKERVAIIFGSGIGGLKTLKDQTENYLENGIRRLSPFFIPMIIPDIASGYISIRHGFRGPNYCVVSACATGNNNIGDAFMMIQRGTVDGALCGGSEAPINELGVGGFNAMKALSTRNDDPTRASRPFDATRDGFVLGEGAGALYLEEFEQARARGARIYAEVVGIGMSADANHITAPHPEGYGAALAMRNVLRDADLQPEDIDYLNMHGTSTPLGDTAETKSVKRVFGEHAYRMNLSSTKSMMGHLLGAAGAVEAIATILAIHHDTVPPTINFEHDDPDCDLNYTFNEPQQRPVNVAINNAFGFGGHNTSLAFRKYEE